MFDRACISLGEKCNLKCNYCHFHNEENMKLSGLSQEFSSVELINIINNINDFAINNELKTFKIGLVGSGEPLLQYKKIVSLISYVKNNNLNKLAFYTITNGTIINKNILHFFYEYKDIIQLCFSLDGYEELHNIGREKYHAVFKGIQMYESVFNKKPPVNCTVHNETAKNTTKLRNYFETENFTNVTFSRLFDSHNETLKISEKKYKELLSEFRGTQFEIRQFNEINKKKYDCTMYGTLCGVGRTNIFITKKGIYPCGRFYGNEKYNYGPFNMSLIDVETKMKKMEILKDGECYFDNYVVVDN